MKYWNARRVKREKEKKQLREDRVRQRYLEQDSKDRTYSKGDARKNALLMFEALGSVLHRRMLSRLRVGGAMSVSHLARPFGIMLPDAMRHVHILERAGLITTHKHGRIRFCVYNTSATRELSLWLAMRTPFDVD